ncbi:N-acetylglucosamine kinase, partial [Peterkaempfera griseoplana]|uniref:N-acetylglucosamine kinase n=1 Tax=Peterkaempfera griseoplana TaxID=66896 RepID=UPI0006E3994E
VHRISQVAGCVIGLSGYRSLADPVDFAARCGEALGLTVPVRVVPDAVTAFASGTDEPRGTVLIAGTGAVCCQVTHHRVEAVRGGLGWLLGDEGAGFWLGREALRRAHTHPDSRLGSAVLRHCAATCSEGLVRWAYAGAPARLARLAPLVSEAALLGDPTALSLADSAARHLAELVRSTVPPGEHGPVVLAGSVASSPGPVRDLLVGHLADCRPLAFATDPAAAAARLAATPADEWAAHGAAGAQ